MAKTKTKIKESATKLTAADTTMHKHPIIAIADGGKCTPENTMTLSVREHMVVHELLWKEHHRWEDKMEVSTLARLVEKLDELLPTV